MSNCSFSKCEAKYACHTDATRGCKDFGSFFPSHMVSEFISIALSYILCSKWGMNTEQESLCVHEHHEK